MKRIIGLSAAICLLISVMAGFGAFAADTTYYDIDFDSWDINVDTTGDNPVEDLNDALASVTGTTDGLWTAELFSGDAKVSTVAWEGKGNVLKLEGTPHNETTDATLKIKVPYEGYDIAAAPYNNDRLVLEYDVYIQGDDVDLSVNAAQFYYTVFGEYGYNELAHWAKNEKVRPYTRQITAASRAEDGTETADSNAQVIVCDNGLEFKTWYNLKWVIDAKSGTPYVYNDTEFATFEKTATLYVTNLGTNVTTSKTVHLPPTRWIGKDFLLGGAIRNTSNMEGVYYVDNFKLYRQSKFAFASSADDEATNVKFDRKTVSFTMNAPVLASSLTGITLTGDGNTVDIDADVSESDNKTVVVTIGEDLSYSTLYTLDFGSVKRSDGTAIELGETTITFTTEAAPALYVTETSLYKGSDVYVTDEASIAADGGLYTFAAKVKSTVNETKQATAIIAVYDVNGNLVKTTAVSKNITALKEETIAAGMTVPAELAGGKVKMFLWNNLTKMQPYIKSLAEDIAASN